MNQVDVFPSRFRFVGFRKLSVDRAALSSDQTKRDHTFYWAHVAAGLQFNKLVCW